MKGFLLILGIIVNSIIIISCNGNYQSDSKKINTFMTNSTPSSNGAILIAGQSPVINTAESAAPMGTLVITNAGNSSATLESKSATSGISSLNGCTTGSSLNIGESCTITFNVLQYNGSGVITLNYTTGNTSSSVSQAITWYNSINGSLVNMDYSSPVNLNGSTTLNDTVTITNIGGYTLTNVNVLTSQTLSGTATTTISYPNTNSCESATLEIGEDCQYILNIKKGNVEQDQQILFGISGDYNNGSQQTYSRYAILTYSALPFTYLYTNNFDGNNLSAFSVTNSESVAQISGSPFAAGTEPAGSVATPNGQFMYVANIGSNNISGFSVNSSNGILTNISGSPFSAGNQPDSPRISPNGQFMYMPDSNAISGYSIESVTGVLTQVSGSPYSTGTLPLLLAIDATGNYVYAIVTNENAIGHVAEYQINQSNGSLSSIGNINTGNYPNWLLIDNTNKFLYVTNSSSSNLSAFSINSTTGVLSSIATYSVGLFPVTMAITPNNQFLYVVSNGDDVIAGFSINQTTGALTSIGDVTVDSSPYGVAAYSNSKFLYVMLPTNITAYSINQSTGALTKIGSYLTGGGSLVSLVIDSVNNLLYVANLTNSLSVYSINSTTGTLTEISGSPFSTGSYPVFIQLLLID